MILTSWLLLIKTTKMLASYFFKIFHCLTAKKKTKQNKKITPPLGKSPRHIKSL